MLAEPIDKMTDIKNPITITDEKPVIDVADDEDLEEGELTESDEENEVVQVATPDLKTRETSHEQPTSNNKKETTSGSEEKPEKENDDRKHSRARRDSNSSKSKKLKQELDADEEKKRVLKEKLRQLERQMQVDDDSDAEDDEDASSGSGSATKRKRSSSRSRSPKKRRRSRSKSPSNRRNNRDRRSRRDQEKKKEICQQYMLGKCPKSPERCPYSHDAEPPKIMELCKFYLLERCAKKEKCLYLHKGFPCKYFHTGHRCLDTAESCKFSHDHLSDVTRNILLKHLEGAPKEILGDFPRLTREAAQTLVFQTEAKNKGWLEEEGKSVQDINKAVGDAVIEEAKKQLPRKSRWNDPSETSAPTPTSDPGPAFGVGIPTNAPNPAILDTNPNLQPLGRPKPFGGSGPGLGGSMGGPGNNSNAGPGLLGPAPVDLRPRQPFGGNGPQNHFSRPQGPGGPRGPGPMMNHFTRPRGGPFQGPQGGQQQQPQMGGGGGGAAFPPGYGDLGFGEEQMRNFIRENNFRQGGQQGPGGPHSGGGGGGGGGRRFDDGPQHMFEGGPGGPQGGPGPMHNEPMQRDMMHHDQMPPHDPYHNNDRRFLDHDRQPRYDDRGGPPPGPFGHDQHRDRPGPFHDDQQQHRGDHPGPFHDQQHRDHSGPFGDQRDRPFHDHQQSYHDQDRSSRPPFPDNNRDPSSYDNENMGGNTTPVNEENDWMDNSNDPVPKRKDPRKDPRRDPRSSGGGPRNDPRSAGPNRNDPRKPSEEEIEKEKEKRMLEVDLSIFGDLELPDMSKDEDNNEKSNENLPFKSVPNAVAKEIEASYNSHSPVEYKLRKLNLIKPDYSEVLTNIPMSRREQDPRLRRYDKMAKPIKKESPGSSPTVTTPKEDPRKKMKSQTSAPETYVKSEHSQQDQQQKPPQPQNVYNPSRDLIKKSSTPEPAVQDVYSPTQDVEDMYQVPAALQRPPDSGILAPGASGGYNPRQDLFAGGNPAWDTNYDHPQSHPAPPNNVRGLDRDPRAARRDPRRRD